METRGRICVVRVIGTTTNFYGAERMIGSLQDDDRREIQQQVDLRGVNLALLRSNVDAHTSAVQLARFAGRLAAALFVRAMAMLTAAGRWRRGSGICCLAVCARSRVVPATTPEAVSDESRGRQQGHQLPEH